MPYNVEVRSAFFCFAIALSLSSFPFYCAHRILKYPKYNVFCQSYTQPYLLYTHTLYLQIFVRMYNTLTNHVFKNQRTTKNKNENTSVTAYLWNSLKRPFSLSVWALPRPMGTLHFLPPLQFTLPCSRCWAGSERQIGCHLSYDRFLVWNYKILLREIRWKDDEDD